MRSYARQDEGWKLHHAGGRYLPSSSTGPYVTKDQPETSVVFELISARYERRSLMITVNQPFAEWGRIFPDQAMTLAAIDRLVHQSTILEMNVHSYCRKEAIESSRSAGRPPSKATIKSAT